MATAGAAFTGGSSTGTSNRTAVGTPAVGQLLVVLCAVAANTNDVPTCTDNQGGTYTRLFCLASTISAIAHRFSVFVRDSLVSSAVSHTITVATGSNTAGVVVVVPVTGMTRTGASAVRSQGTQANAAAGTPAPTLNQAALTGNLTIVGVDSADSTTTPPTGWTERADSSQTSDAVSLEVATRDSGFTGTAITFGAAQSTVFSAMAIELDTSVAPTNVDLGALASTLVVRTPSVGVAATADAIDQDSVTHTPAADVAVTPGTIASTLSTAAPRADVAIGLALIPSTLVVHAPSVVSGGAIDLPAIDSTLVVSAPRADVVATPGTIGPSATASAPSAADAITLPTIGPMASVLAPSVSSGVGLALIPSTLVVRTPSVLVGVNLPAIGPLINANPPTSNPSIGLALIPSTLVVHAPSVAGAEEPHNVARMHGAAVRRHGLTRRGR